MKISSEQVEWLILSPQLGFADHVTTRREEQINHFDIDKIVDEINRRMGDSHTTVITHASMGMQSSGKCWKMRVERCSPDWHELPVGRV